MESHEEFVSKERKNISEFHHEIPLLRAILLELRILNKLVKNWTTPSYGNFAVNDSNIANHNEIPLPPPPPPITTRHIGTSI
jgi:hypothetical protein